MTWRIFLAGIAILIVLWLRRRRRRVGPDERRRALNRVVVALIRETEELSAAGQHEQARDTMLRAIRLAESVLGPDDNKVLTLYNNLSIVYRDLGRYQDAEELLLTVLSKREKRFGSEHDELIAPLSNLAILYMHKAEFERAEPLLQRGLRIVEKRHKSDDPMLARFLGSLGDLYRSTNQFQRAEPILQRALALREAQLGPDHPDVAFALNNLAVLYTRLSFFDQALALQERAIKILVAAIGDNHISVGVNLNSIGWLHRLRGEYERAEPILQCSLHIYESQLGPNHPELTFPLLNLGDLFLATNEHDRALPMYQRAFRILKDAGLAEHLHNAFLHNNLARLYQDTGDFENAIKHYTTALEISEATVDPIHEQVALPLHNLAFLHALCGNLDEALPLFWRSFSILETLLGRVQLVATEERLNSFLSYLHQTEHVIYSLLWVAPPHPELPRLSLAVALLRKARSLDAAAELSRALTRIQRGSEEAALLERLRAHRGQLAALLGSKTPSLVDRDAARRIEAAADDLERQLIERCGLHLGDVKLPEPQEIIGRVADVLPEDSALLEVIELYPKSPKDVVKACHYLAIILRPHEQIHVEVLGPAAPIDAAIRRFLTLITDAAEVSRSLQTEQRLAPSLEQETVVAAAQSLYQLVMAPLARFLSGCRRIYLSLDGQLCFVPFAALHDGQDFLLERYIFNYLTAGRDLLRRRPDVKTERVCVFADPAFSQLAPLPGTRREAEAIQTIFPNAELFLGQAASKAALLEQAPPRILHIATHGLFLSSDAVDAALHESLGTGAQPTSQPLLLSALALAGAAWPVLDQQAAPALRPQAGLVTALEVASMSLWGTELVVLSACDTGRGEVKLGHGVYGLRRAVLLAGAQTLLTSLWKVHDEVTVTLMTEYYKRILDGHGLVDALRLAAMEMKQRHAHPAFWAPFIAIGSEAPLSRRSFDD